MTKRYSVDDYAAWIVANQDKKGTPEFESVAEAYRKAKFEGAANFQGLRELGKLAGETVTDLSSKVFGPGPVAAGLGTAAHVTAETVPAMLMGGGIGGSVGRVAEAGTKALSRGLMKSAIKPTITDLERGRVPSAIDTMLEEGYSPTNAGIAAMRQRVSNLKSQVGGITDNSTNLVSTQQAEQYLQALANKLRQKTLGADDVAQVQAVLQRLRQHPSVDQLGLMSVRDAQAMKELNTTELGNAAYGLGLRPSAERDALKQVNRALRVGIEGAEPGVIAPNAEASNLLNAVKVSTRRALMESNKDPLPLGAGVGAAMNNPAAALGMYANSSAYIKALLARLLYKGSDALPVTGAGIGAGTAAGIGEDHY